MSAFFFEGDEIITLRTDSLKKIKQAAKESPLKRARYCLHHDLNDPVHEMVIATCHDSYIRPHRHINKSESFHIIEGKLKVVFFDDMGNVTKRITMGPFGGEDVFLYRLSCGLWHTVIPVTELVVIHETTTGPFIKEETMFPQWAPIDTDKKGIEIFMKKIRA